MEKAVLVKFGELNHLQLLRDDGQIYMNNLTYFRKIEDDDLRGDRYDSVNKMQRGSKGKVTIPSTGKQLKVTDFEIGIGPEDAENINLFCMYAVRFEYGSYPIPKENFRFGSYALIIHNVDLFLKRLGTELKKQKIIAESNLVEYLHNNYTGILGPFKKLKKFNYQSEWRLVCKNGVGKERVVNIGSLADISIIVEAKNINDEFTFLN